MCGGSYFYGGEAGVALCVQNVWGRGGWCGKFLIIPDCISIVGQVHTIIKCCVLTYPPDIFLIFDITITHNGDEPLKD